MENQKEQWAIIQRHYYGDAIRTIFLVTGALMIITFPFFSDLVPLPIPVSISIMILLVVFGGLLNPVQKFLLVINSIVPILGFAVFEYQATYGYTHLLQSEPRASAFFWINQIIALLFFVATYLSIKTVRGRFIKEIE